MHNRDFFNIGAAVLAALAAVPVVAMAMDARTAVLDAKTAGVVGEQADGFLGLVKPTNDTALKEAVAEINAGRAQLYREAAAKNGVAVEAAGASAFTGVVQGRLRPGDYYKPAGGAWMRK